MDTFPDVMVDVETTGTSPDRTAMIQLAAVKFSLKDGTVSHDFFDRCLEIPAHRFWAEDTRHWWMQQKRSVLDDIFRRMENPVTVMQDFVRWVIGDGSVQGPTFWSKPSHFDFMFVSSYCKDYGLPMPFHFRVANDMNSYIRGLYAGGEVPADNIEFEGDVHNALMDSLHQISVLFHHQTAART
jgi:hypothetical protein